MDVYYICKYVVDVLQLTAAVSFTGVVVDAVVTSRHFSGHRFTACNVIVGKL